MDIQQMFFGLIAFFGIILILFIVGALWFMAGKEGRFMIRRFIRRDGIDLLQYRRLSQELKLKKLKWDGKYWIDQEDISIMTGIDPEKGTDPATEQYNKAVASTGRWEGNRRPLLLATEEMFFAFSHGFLDMLKNTSNFQKYLDRAKDDVDEAKKQREEDYKSFITELGTLSDTIKDSDQYKQSKYFLMDLLNQIQLGYKGVQLMTIISPEDVHKFLDGATSRVLMEARDDGKVEGSLEMTMPEPKQGIPPMVKAIAISASVIISLVIAYVAITGRNPVEGIKSVIPS